MNGWEAWCGNNFRAWAILVYANPCSVRPTSVARDPGHKC